MIHTLGYADDITLVEEASAEGINRSTKRLTDIAAGSSEEDADMSISIPKTNVMHVQRQDPVTKTTTEEAIAACKFECPHMGCTHVFRTKHGMSIHAGT